MNRYILILGNKMLQLRAISTYHAIEEFKRHFKIKNNGNIKVKICQE